MTSNKGNKGQIPVFLCSGWAHLSSALVVKGNGLRLCMIEKETE